MLPSGSLKRSVRLQLLFFLSFTFNYTENELYHFKGEILMYTYNTYKPYNIPNIYLYIENLYYFFSNFIYSLLLRICSPRVKVRLCELLR